MRASPLIAMLALAACSSRQPSPGEDVTCGTGTQLIDDVCLPILDAAPADAGADAPPDAHADAAVDAGGPDAPWPDAAIQVDEATAFAIDPAHDNLQPTDTVASPLAPAWTASFDGAVSFPLVVGGLVIVSVAGSPPTVRALDLHTGALVWGPIVFGERPLLAYDEGKLFAIDFNGRVTALDLVTGRQLWLFEILPGATFFGPPVAAGGTVYINGPGYRASAYDEQTGALRWQSDAVGDSEGCLAVTGGAVYQTAVCDEIFAWNALTGDELWSHAGTCSGGGGASPSVFGGNIWERDDLGNDAIYDLTGNSIGTFAADAAPAFHGGTAFYETNQNLEAVDIATKATLWTFVGDGRLCTAPVVAGTGGQVFVGSALGHVYELDAATGAQRSVHDAGSAITCFSETSTLTLGEGHLLVPAGNQLIVY